MVRRERFDRLAYASERTVEVYGVAFLVVPRGQGAGQISQGGGACPRARPGLGDGVFMRSDRLGDVRLRSAPCVAGPQDDAQAGEDDVAPWVSGRGGGDDRAHQCEGFVVVEQADVDVGTVL